MGSGHGGGAVEGQAQLHLKGVRFVALLHLKIHVVQQLQAVATLAKAMPKPGALGPAWVLVTVRVA